MINLRLGDCLELMKDIPDKSVDLVVIDPPYELETKRGGGFFRESNEKRRKYQDEIKSMMIGISEQLLDILCNKMKKVNMYIFCSRTQMLSLLKYAEKKQFSWNLLTWHKTNPIPTCNNKYLNDTEYIVFMREKGEQVFGSYHTKKSYFITSVNKKEKQLYGHPTIKPLDIIENLIVNSSQENDTILDCFMGSGTTGVACKKLNRNFIGIELSQEYFNIAKEIIEKER